MIKKIIIRNLIGIFIVLFLFEIISFFYLSYSYRKQLREMEFPNNFLHYSIIKSLNNKNIDTISFRETEYKSNTKPPIIIFGCSYAYGHELKKEETFSSQLAKMTDRTVINRAHSGEGPAFMYFQLSDEKIIEKIKGQIKNMPEPEYIIYVYIPGHNFRHCIYRASVYSEYFRKKYSLVGNDIVSAEPKFSLLHSLFSAMVFEHFAEKLYCTNSETNEKTVGKLILESFKLAKKNFNNSKFVILYFPDGLEDHSNHNEIKDFLKNINEEIQVIDIQDYINMKNKDLWLENDNNHPNAKAWELTVPIIIKELKLN